jgi:hypothetical protein
VDSDSFSFWHSIGGGAIIAAALTLARLLLEYGIRGGDRRIEHEERRRAGQRDAEARLERILQDRLAESDRRLDRCEQDVQTERVRSSLLEHEHARLLHAHELLKQQYASLEMDYARLDGERRLPARD